MCIVSEITVLTVKGRKCKILINCRLSKGLNSSLKNMECELFVMPFILEK